MKFPGIVFLFASLKAVGAKESNPTQRNKLRGGLEEELRHRQQQERQLDADTYIFETVADGAAQGQGDKVGTSCSTDGRWMSFVDDAVDYMDIATTKWHSPGYRMDCKDKGSHTNWQCWATCSPFPNPNFLDWTYLTMEVKLVNAANLATGCGPNIKITKRWPSYSSNVLSLSGDYVDGGALADSEFRRVVIPMADFATTEWPDLKAVKDVLFLNCGTGYSVNPHYQVRSLLLTDNPPALASAPEAPASTNAPTAVLSESPTAAPTAVLSESPTAAPTVPLWPIFKTVQDSHASGDVDVTCFIQKDRLDIAATEDPTGDYFTVTPDAWVSGGYQFGCMQKDENHQCTRSCFTEDGSAPDWSNKLYLTFLAKIDGDFGEGCKPMISLTGGGWPRLSSNTLVLEDSYVDAGFLVADEWRQVVIPLEDFKTPEWSLTAIFGLYFQTCGQYGGTQPTYIISQLAVTNIEYEVLSQPPSLSPTSYVTDDPSLATHRWVHKNWYPILGEDWEPEDNTWIVASENTWPTAPSGALPSSVTVQIPQGQSVMYSGTDGVHYDKIVVEGALTIKPIDADVFLKVGTIVVEKGGALDIQTDSPNDYKIVIEIDGALNQEADPEEQLIGIVSLEGNLTISGNEVPTKMAPLGETATAGSNTLVVYEMDLSNDFAVGGELILPDTQIGLNVGHYNFLNLGVYVDQTESCVISSLTANAFLGGGSLITCESPLFYDHTSGFNLGYITRSITIRTSSSSQDNGHILHTGVGKFDVLNTRIENLGRTTTDLIDSTVMSPVGGVKFPRDTTYVQMNVTKLGANQIARYALHAHHSLAESYFSGNALLYSPRDGCVAHDSRVHILDNVIVGADGTGIFLEDATETGPVMNNFIIGTGGGSRGGDDGRFSIAKGKDMAHGGFGIWARGKLALVQGNHCEGHFGRSPYGFFVHPNFLGEKRVPDVPGTPPELVGKLLKEIPVPDGNGLQLQTYGGFVNNSAIGTFAVGIDMSYFATNDDDEVGTIIEGANIVSLASSGMGIMTTHSRLFTLDHVTIDGEFEGNTITGIWCNNCNGCTLQTPNTTLVIENVDVVRGGNC